MTPQTPPTDRPLTAGDVRYVEGHLDMTHAPSLSAFIGKSLASHVSGNRMPAMSGDDRERIPAHIRERFDRDCESTAKYILDHLSSPATSAASEGEDEFGPTETAIAQAAVDGFRSDLAALASPPVSERERELEGALRRQADNMAFVVNHASLYAWHDKFVAELEEDRALLTAQPTGEGK